MQKIKNILDKPRFGPILGPFGPETPGQDFFKNNLGLPLLLQRKTLDKRAYVCKVFHSTFTS